MTSDSSRARLIGLLGATAAAALAMATLLPTKWVPRTGLGWQDEHFVVYFATTAILCIASRRPYVVAISLITFSGLLEALQGLTPDRLPDFTAALAGTAGVISGATLVMLFIRAIRSLMVMQRRCYASVSSGMGRQRGRLRLAALLPGRGAPTPYSHYEFGK
jgi:VanZ family protein